MAMNVLVTGASGFLGRYILDILLESNFSVTVLARKKSELGHFKKPGIRIVKADLRDGETLSNAIHSVDAIIHCAATMRGNWENYYKVNVLGTKSLLELGSALHIKRFIYISSVIVYDHSGNAAGTVFKEKMPYETDALTNYSRSKIEAEKVVMAFHHDHGLPTVILRPGALFGEGGQIFPSRTGFSLGPIYLLIGRGNVPLSLTHVSSVSDAILRSLKNENATGKIYNVVEDKGIEQYEFLQQFKRTTGERLFTLKMPYSAATAAAWILKIGLAMVKKQSPIRIPYLRLCARSFFYSTNKIKTELNWQPLPDMQQNIETMMEQYRISRKPVRDVPLKGHRIEIASADVLRTGICGCGMFADTHIKFLKKFKHAQLVALCDTDQKILSMVGKKHQKIGLFSDYTQMLKESGLDVLHILTPAQSHAPLAITALNSKVHVLVEKPMASNQHEAGEMVRVAKENQMKLCVDHNHLYDLVMIKARSRIAKGAIGKPLYVESWYGTDYSANRGSRYLDYDAKDTWAYTMPGQLYQNMISHPISLLCDVMGDINDIRAAATYAHVVPHMNTDELRLLVGNGHMLGLLSMSFAVSPRHHFMKIYGNRGTMKIDFLNKYYTIEKTLPILPKVVSRNIGLMKNAISMAGAVIRNGFLIARGQYSLFEGNERLIHLFYRSIMLDEKEPVTGEEGLESMRIMDEVWRQLSAQAAT